MGVAGGLESVCKSMPLGPLSVHRGKRVLGRPTATWLCQKSPVPTGWGPSAQERDVSLSTFHVMKHLKSSADRTCQGMTSCFILLYFI